MTGVQTYALPIYIFRLSPGISVPAQFQFMSSDQTVYTEQSQIESITLLLSLLVFGQITFSFVSLTTFIHYEL